MAATPEGDHSTCVRILEKKGIQSVYHSRTGPVACWMAIPFDENHYSVYFGSLESLGGSTGIPISKCQSGEVGTITIPMMTGDGPFGSVEMTDGVIRKIDRNNSKITIKHGEIRNLDMPGMTMVFQVKHPELLE